MTHARLQTIANGHSTDTTKDLQHLVKTGFLNSSGGRGAVYTLPGIDVIHPDEVFASSRINESSSRINNDLNNSHRDQYGRLLNQKLSFPLIDDISLLQEHFQVKLLEIAEQIRNKKRTQPKDLEQVIIELCREQFLTISVIAQLTQRKTDTLRKLYLSRMVKENQLLLAFPTIPTHEKQAYRAANNKITHPSNR